MRRVRNVEQGHELQWYRHEEVVIHHFQYYLWPLTEDAKHVRLCASLALQFLWHYAKYGSRNSCYCASCWKIIITWCERRWVISPFLCALGEKADFNKDLMKNKNHLMIIPSSCLSRRSRRDWNPRYVRNNLLCWGDWKRSPATQHFFQAISHLRRYLWKISGKWIRTGQFQFHWLLDLQNSQSIHFFPSIEP